MASGEDVVLHVVGRVGLGLVGVDDVTGTLAVLGFGGSCRIRREGPGLGLAVVTHSDGGSHGGAGVDRYFLDLLVDGGWPTVLGGEELGLVSPAQLEDLDEEALGVQPPA